MIGKSENKMLPVTGTKFTPAQQAAFDAKTVGSGMTDAEASAVGRAVMLAAEQRVRAANTLRHKMDAASQPDQADLKVLADREAVHRAARTRTSEAHIECIRLQRAVRAEVPNVFNDEVRSILSAGNPTEAELALRAAQRDLEQREREEAMAYDALVQIRSRIDGKRAKARFVVMARDAGIA